MKKGFSSAQTTHCRLEVTTFRVKGRVNANLEKIFIYFGFSFLGYMYFHGIN